jgi:hypothetical protein
MGLRDPCQCTQRSQLGQQSAKARDFGRAASEKFILIDGLRTQCANRTSPGWPAPGETIDLRLG